jgi:indole-3-glycerol phosphate synthase
VSILDDIVRAHRRAAAADDRPIDVLVAQTDAAPPPRSFRAALSGGRAVIAEIKRRSPSKGDLAPDLVPSVLAKAYATGGASCLSVLTDEAWFGGSVVDLVEARAACELPVLRKDFTVSERDVLDARNMGADAVLLIAAALSDEELRRFRVLASRMNMDALVEVHTRAELDRALAAGADVVGVNQRDLTTFEVDRALAARLREHVPDEVVTVAESGIRDGRDADELFQCGYDAILVGESLVTSPDPAGAIRELTRRPGGGA